MKSAKMLSAKCYQLNASSKKNHGKNDISKKWYQLKMISAKIRYHQNYKNLKMIRSINKIGSVKKLIRSDQECSDQHKQKAKKMIRNVIYLTAY